MERQPAALMLACEDGDVSGLKEHIPLLHAALGISRDPYPGGDVEGESGSNEPGCLQKTSIANSAARLCCRAANSRKPQDGPDDLRAFGRRSSSEQSCDRNLIRFLDDSRLSRLSASLADVFETLDVSKSLGGLATSSLRESIPFPAGFAETLDEASETAVALAEVEAVGALVDIEAVGLQALSPSQQRALAIEVVLLIAAFLMVYAFRVNDVDLAAASLTCAAALVRVYWRLVGSSPGGGSLLNSSMSQMA